MLEEVTLAPRLLQHLPRGLRESLSTSRPKVRDAAHVFSDTQTLSVISDKSASAVWFSLYLSNMQI